MPPTLHSPAVAAPQSLKAPLLGFLPRVLETHVPEAGSACCASVSPSVEHSWARLFLETSNAVHDEP